MALLEPVVALLDETDSGLDIDALRTVAKGVRTVREQHPSMGAVVVTHYVKLLDEIRPDFVHVLFEGRVVHSGGPELASVIDREGYDALATGERVTSFSARRVRADIPLLHRVVNDHPITYLDSGASSLQPRAVIEAMSRYYELRHANVHRGVYQTANEATEAYEGSRAAVASFIDAPGGASEVVFTKNTTESLNLVAQVLGGHPPAPRGRRARDRDGAPRQHRAVVPTAREPRRRASASSPLATTSGSTSRTSTSCSTA